MRSGHGEAGKGMLTVEGWTTIRYLHAQGLGVRAICRELGVARKTVRRALRGDGAPKYERPPRPNAQLEPFAAQIRELYFAKRLIGSRILRELRALGYAGSPSAFYAHLKRLKVLLPPGGKVTSGSRRRRGTRPSSTGRPTRSSSRRPWRRSSARTWTCGCTPPPASAPSTASRLERPHLTPLPEGRQLGGVEEEPGGARRAPPSPPSSSPPSRLHVSGGPVRAASRRPPRRAQAVPDRAEAGQHGRPRAQAIVPLHRHQLQGSAPCHADSPTVPALVG